MESNNDKTPDSSSTDKASPRMSETNALHRSEAKGKASPEGAAPVTEAHAKVALATRLDSLRCVLQAAQIVNQMVNAAAQDRLARWNNVYGYVPVMEVKRYEDFLTGRLDLLDQIIDDYIATRTEAMRIYRLYSTQRENEASWN